MNPALDPERNAASLRESYERMLRRNPQLRDYYEKKLKEQIQVAEESAAPAGKAPAAAPAPRASYEVMYESGVGPAPSAAVAAAARSASASASASASPAASPYYVALETIVRDDRPVLFVQQRSFDFTPDRITTSGGPEAKMLVDDMKAAQSRLIPFLPLIGRIDVANFPYRPPFVGTGWFIAEDIVITNRHVAEFIAAHDGTQFQFKTGNDGLPMDVTFNNAHEYDDPPATPDRIFKVDRVLYIAPPNGPHDIAYLKVTGKPAGDRPRFLSIAAADAAADTKVCVIGYPAQAPSSIIPDQSRMAALYLNRYDVKRAAPGFMLPPQDDITGRHDCTTLGGASGSPVLSLATAEVVGLHFSGLYRTANYTVSASVLNRQIHDIMWARPYEINERPQGNQQPTAPTPVPSSDADLKKEPQSPTAPATPTAPAAPDAITLVIPGVQQHTLSVPLILNFSIGLGQGVLTSQPAQSVNISATVGGQSQSHSQPQTLPAPPPTIAQVERAAITYWRQRPSGAVAARVGFAEAEAGETIGDQPFLAISVLPAQYAAFEAKEPHTFEGVPIRYFPAEVGEQVEALPVVEAAATIAYDDDARTGDDFSLDPIEEEMDVLLHVGPEYSWAVLHDFLCGSSVQEIHDRIEQSLPQEDVPVAKNGRLTSAIYEFHGPAIKDALEARLNKGASLQLVADGVTFSTLKPAPTNFDRVAVMSAWLKKYKNRFSLITAKEGPGGLISMAYHIKVTVRDDDVLWQSSGNWKQESSQPVITATQLEAAAAGKKDLPGNREWHIVLRNSTLATRFRSHIQQDFQRSKDLGGTTFPASKMPEAAFIDVPLAEEAPGAIPERPAPSGIVMPQILSGLIKVQPLLTPDKQGAIYSKAVLRLIRSAKKTLAFQIPYIGMPKTPGEHRGYIDDLIDALIDKLLTLGSDNARVLLRAGGSALSSPQHAAWYFKSKGVDISSQVRLIENSHTKGLIVDGKRVLVGSHNWSSLGVTLNRDASFLFDNTEAAAFYAQAFEIDWARSSPITPKKFVPKPKPARESTLLEATGDQPPPGYRRVSLNDWLAEQGT